MFRCPVASSADEADVCVSRRTVGHFDQRLDVVQVGLDLGVRREPLHVFQQRRGRCRVPGQPGRLGGGAEPPGPDPGIGGQRAGPPQCCRGGAETPAGAGALSALLEGVGDGVVWPCDAGCLVPCPAVRIGCADEYPVDHRPISERCALVHRGTDEGMAEDNAAGTDAQQASCRGAVDVVWLDSELLGGCEHDGGVTGGVCGGQQQPLAGRGQGAGARQKRVLQRGSQRQRLGQRIPAAELLAGQHGRQLQQGQRVAVGKVQNLHTDGCVEGRVGTLR